MRRRLITSATSVVFMIAAALFVGGKAGLIGGSLAVVLVAAGTVIGIPGLITAAGAASAGTYLAALVLQQSPLDLEAPLVGTLLVAGLEIGHLSLEGDRYSLPGGKPALATRAALTTGVCLVGLAAAWLILLGAYFMPRPGEAVSVVAGVVAALGVFAVLVMLRSSSAAR